MNLITPISYFTRKLLYLWVRSSTLPENLEPLKISSGKPLIYVVETRGWTNLLVLEHECVKRGLPSPRSRISSSHFRSWHSVYTIAPRQPFKAWLQKQPKRSRMIRGLLEVLREFPDDEIQFIPVSIFWGRPVSKQKHWLTVLFADSWGIAGRTRKFFTILFHGRHTLVNFSEPISFKNNVNSQFNNDENIDHIQQILSDRLLDMRAATLGPDISHRRILVRKLLINPDVKEAITRRSVEDNFSQYKATLQARRYLYEIVADRTYITIQILQRGLSAFWNKFYSGITVNHSDQLKKLALSHELVYVPCHRSHIDYLLLSYVIHFEGLAVPYIAAGKNLNMPIIGPILRGAGAFFIRRSFRGNELYSTLMFEYVAMLISMGMPIKYFIEGGRSRTGRLLTPKPGMLSITIRGFLKYRKRPVAFVPVYIGYEKMLEGKSYIAELSGNTKKSETLFASIRSMLDIKGDFGKVYTNFGTPVLLEEILTNNHPQWASWDYRDNYRPDWLKNTVTQVARQIMTGINSSASVNSTNLISMALLVSPKQHMGEKELVSILDLYVSLINSIKYSDQITVTTLNGRDQISRVEKLGFIKRKQHQLGDIVFIDPKHSIFLTYYRNNILHLMALPSLVACCFLNARAIEKEKIIKLVKLAYPFLKSEFFLPWDKNNIEDHISRILETYVASGLLHINPSNGSYSRPGTGKREHTQLNMLAKIILPILELYYIIFALLVRNESRHLTQSELEELCFLTSQRLSMIHDQFLPDHFDKKLINNFITSLITFGYLDNDEGYLAHNPALGNANRDVRLLLSAQMRNSILHMIKQETHN